jgi:hypothetical protein
VTTHAKTRSRNGTAEDLPLVEAIAYEDAIREEAEAIWTSDERAANAGIDPFVFRELRSLLRKPIPAGFIEHVGEVTGKPYASSGVRSVQVQMDRLDNVLGPNNWGYEATHSEDGKRCYVKAWVGPASDPLFTRDSWGGVNRGSTEGNIFKGSFTNAAKLALARLGPGWEVYVGAADFDPDTDEAAAKAQQGGGEDTGPRKLSAEKVEALAKVIETAGLTPHLATKLRGFGKKRIEDLTVEQGLGLFEWATKKPDVVHAHPDPAMGGEERDGEPNG